jgi:thymidylate kinase
MRIPGIGLALRLTSVWRTVLGGAYHQARGRLVIYDRYTYDLVSGPRDSGSAVHAIWRWVLSHSAPRPDLALVLDAPVEQLRARKMEHELSEISRQRERYGGLHERLSGLVVVDASKPEDTIRREVTAIIWRRWSKRLARG